MLSHFYHHHHHHLLLQYSHVTRRIYTPLCRRKIKPRPIAARGGRVCLSTFDSRGLGSAWRHPLLCAPAETRKDALKARLQHLRVRASRNIASPSSARAALQHTIQAPSAGFIHLHAGSAGFLSLSVSPLVHFLVLFIIRASSQLLAVRVLADHWGHILFSSRRAPSQSRKRGRFPHHLLLISVQPRASGYLCVFRSVSSAATEDRRTPKTFISSWFHI